MNERRGAPRVQPKKPLAARVKAFLPARIVDLSELGVQLELATSLRPQVPCDLRIQLDDGEVVVRGLVRRCRAWGFGLDERDQRVLLYRAGLEFETKPPEALLQVVASVLEKASPPQVPAPSGAAGAPEQAPEQPVVRAPHGGGRVKVRIAAEQVRKVLSGRGSKDEK
ncbi:MAG TPA: PilZ domain-containing protein [Thermoanaerobaculaceae bacterium]|nr:PilZ domain-containing protein [Thermoanaerobaculaceae bacterium]